MMTPQASWADAAQAMVDNQVELTRQDLAIDFARAIFKGKMSLDDAALNLYDSEFDDLEELHEAGLIMAYVVDYLENHREFRGAAA